MRRWLIFLLIVSFPVSATANLTATEGLAIDLTSAGAGLDFTIIFDPTELLGSRTWGNASTDTIVWTFDRLTGTDPTITFNSGSIALQALTLITDLAVTEGGTGASTLTDGGILLGTGTSAVHALGVATNGQIPIGDGTTDPVLATLTGTASEIDITNAAGSITIGLVDPLAVTKGGTGAAAFTNLFTLTTDTIGNYVASANTSALTGLTGGSAGSEGAALSLAFDYTATLAANPALAANASVFGTTGLIAEGATADLIETLLTFADPTAADKTITLPDLTGTVILSGHTFTGDATATIGASNTTALTVAADSVALTTDTTGNYVATVADGTGIDGTASAEGATYTPTFDATELTGLTWSAGGSATFNWIFNVSTGTDPNLQFGNGIMNLAQGTLQQGGTAVSLSTHDHAATYQPLEATLTDIADGTIAEDLVNTANPWADNEVSDVLTIGATGSVADGAIPAGITRDTEWDTTTEINAATTDADFSVTTHNHSGTYEPTDPNLTAIAGLTTSANTLNYWTGAGTTVLTNLTAFGRSIIDDADEATFKATVNLEIGTDVQAYDPNLTGIAAVNWTSGQFVQSSGSGNFTGVTQNAGTNITADLEEEAHASEHQDTGADEIAVTAGMMNAGTGASVSTYWRGDNTWATPAGSGDMTKAVYDVANDGFVDANDTAYAASWNATINAPSRNAVYDKIEGLSSVYQPLEATLTDIADGTIAENLVNIANPWAANEITEADPLALLTAGTDNVKDTHVDWGSGASQVNLADIPGGISGASVWDFGGATSLEIPNADNPTTDATGEIAVDANNSFIEFYDGTASRIVQPLLRCDKTIWDPDGMQIGEDAVPLMRVEPEWAPFGITIVDIFLAADASNSTTYVLEEWTDPITWGSDIESCVFAASTEFEDDGTLADASIAAGNYVFIDLSTQALNFLNISFTYRINEGN